MFFFFKILISKVISVTFGILRRPPNANDFLNSFLNDFQQINNKTNEIYLIGDFNPLTTMAYLCPSISAAFFSVIDKDT